MKTDFANRMKNQGINTPQTQPFGGATEKNYAGGYAFPTSEAEMLKRFLILGADTRTYYVNEKVQVDNFLDTVKKVVDADPNMAIDLAIHASNNAPRIDPAIFTLAVATTSQDEKARSRALKAINEVCRIPTHYFKMARFIRQLRGWSPQVSAAFNKYYHGTPVAKLAYHAVKYKQREGFSHRDLLRLCHPKAHSEKRNQIFKYMTSGTCDFDPQDEVFYPILGERLINGEFVSEVSALGIISKYGLTEEMIPDKFKGKMVWDALAPNMGSQAWLRNIVRMASDGYIDIGTTGVTTFLEKFHRENVEKTRLHPIDFLKAYVAYRDGIFMGKGHAYDFNVVPWVTQRLWDGIYYAIPNMKPTNRKILLAYDHSGSMTSPVDFAGVMMAPADMQVILGLLYTKVEPATLSISFGTSVKEHSFTPSTTLDEITNAIPKYGEGTDCSLPIKWLLDKKLKVDALIEFTDQMSWFGTGHVSEWAKKYRQEVNPDFRFVIYQMQPYPTQLTDKNDPLSMGVVGLDTSAVELVGAFLRGELDG